MRIAALTSVMFLFLLPVWGQSQQAPLCAVPDPGNATVEIDGVKLTFADLERKRPTVLFQARNTFYEAQRKALEELIDEYLLEREAQKEKVPVAELLERHVNAKLPADPNDESLRVYFEGLDVKEPFEAVRGKIVEHLRQRRITKMREAYMAGLRANARVSIDLTPPRAEVSLAGVRVLGPAGAPLTLIEYADYECPYCQQIQPAVERVLAEYKDRVAYAYKDLPLPNHPAAQKASEAAHCAGAQDRYWEYHKTLVSGKDLEVPKLKARAREMGLKGDVFDKCLDSGEKAAIVAGNLSEAQGLGLQGTPTLFINGRLLSGLISYEKLREVVEEELKRAGAMARNMSPGQ